MSPTDPWTMMLDLSSGATKVTFSVDKSKAPAASEKSTFTETVSMFCESASVPVFTENSAERAVPVVSTEAVLSIPSEVCVKTVSVVV